MRILGIQSEDTSANGSILYRTFLKEMYLCAKPRKPKNNQVQVKHSIQRHTFNFLSILSALKLTRLQKMYPINNGWYLLAGVGLRGARRHAFPLTSFGCVTGSITHPESYQMMRYEVSSSLWALLRSFISAGNCHQVFLLFSLRFASFGWAIGYCESEGSCDGLTEGDQRVILPPTSPTRVFCATKQYTYTSLYSNRI